MCAPLLLAGPAMSLAADSADKFKSGSQRLFGGGNENKSTPQQTTPTTNTTPTPTTNTTRQSLNVQ